MLLLKYIKTGKKTPKRLTIYQLFKKNHESIKDLMLGKLKYAIY